VRGAPVNPYRKGPRRPDGILSPVDRAAAYRASRLRLAVAAASVLCAAAAIPAIARALRPRRTPADVPAELLTAAAFFPAPRAELPPSVPLEPLLAADAPDRLAVLEPTETALNLRPGEPVILRFNRPMVDGAHVGKPFTSAAPVVFEPPVRGRATWTSRSSLSFEATASAWGDGVRTTSMTLAPELRSLGDEEVSAFDPRTVVFDGGPRFVGKARGDRLMPGEALRLLFSGKVDAAALPSQIMVYEVDGGRRMIPFKLAGQARDAKGNTPVDVALGLALPPGGHLAVAVAPPLSHGGARPRVVELELAPRPRVEGIACSADATQVSQCEFSGPPGAIVDIGETLVLLASEDLAALPAGAVEVSPPLEALTTKLEEGRRLVVRGDWAPGQVYQIRLTGLRDRDGHALERTPPLAVRSAGRAPEVRVARGSLVYERDASPSLPFAAIHVEAGEARIGAIPMGREIEAALDPGRWVGPERAGLWQSVPLFPLVPTSKPNRWAAGALAWSAREASRPSMAALSLLPDRRPRDGNTVPATFVQQTDLGIDARILPRGVLAWITSVASARPVGGARVTLADHAGKVLASVDADDRGLCWFPLDAALDDGAVVRAVQGADRAVLVVDPRTAIGPRHLGVAPGARPLPADAWLATVFTDRGICRPGETIHAKALVRGMVEGELEAPASGHARLALFGPAGEAPIREKLVSLSAFGTADADFVVDPGAEPGAYRVEARFAGQEQPAGSASFTVGAYRPPTYRVDLGAPAGELADHDALRVPVSASHLFGSPAAGARARWTLTRARSVAYPDAWSDYSFEPADHTSRSGTVASGELTLDAAGHAVVETAVALSAPVREEEDLEVSVEDLSGLSTSARRTMITYPATFEIGVRSTPSFLDPGATLDVDAVVMAHDGTAVTGRRVEARIVREGWHTYWEWSGHGRHDEGDDGTEGSYQARRAHHADVVHRCSLTSGAEPVHCAWAADRPGTYLLEATTRDDRGRVAVASERVYVAGPDEHPDRDPPGTALTLTAEKHAFTVGEDAEVAFESPFPEAEALLEVERDGALLTEVRHVSAGGNVFRFPVTAEMVPNAFVSLTMVRPRTGPPGEKLDLSAPDLRVGLTELTVRPAASPLTVTLEAAASAPAGTDVPVEVLVKDAAGVGVAVEVALFAVDEGTLRLTGYALPDPLRGLLPRLPPSFAWEDLRRSLVSRVPTSLLPGPGGDGDGGTHARRRQTDEPERFEPTPLWAPRLVTDASGHAATVLHLPARPTQYRIMALAADEGVRAGRAERTVIAAMPLVVRPVLPGFATVGDRFEAVAFVHNTEDAPAEVTVTPSVDGAPRPPFTVHLEAKSEQRVATLIEVAGPEDLVVRFEARSPTFTALSETRVRVSPRGRVARAEAVGAVAGSRTLTVQIPDAATDGSGAFTLSVAGHPFVGFDTAVDALLASTIDGVESAAASVIGLAAYATLDTGKRVGSLGAAELHARAASALARLAALQGAGGGFGMFTARDTPDGYHSAYALHALVAARRAGFAVDAAILESARAFLTAHVRGNGFIDRDDGHDDLALALRALAESGGSDPPRVAALFDQRERLSPYGLAQLALAMDGWDPRRDTLAVDAQRRALATREDERRDPAVLRSFDRSARTLGAVLEAALAVDAPARDTTRLASQVLETRAVPGGGWWSIRETSHALAALAAYAATVGGGEVPEPRVTLDGAPLAPAERTRALAWYSVPAGRVSGGPHQLRIDVDGAAWFALGARWVVPLGAADVVPRGQDAAIHRVLEDAAGKPLAPDAHVKLGDLVRVRLFVFSEHDTPPFLAVRDRLAGGLEPVDAAHETTARGALWALLGMSPDDDVVDARGHYASRSLDAIAHRAFLPTEAVFYLKGAGHGLREITYGVRAVAVGTFVLPPTEIEALYEPGFTARSAVTSLTVDP
jgi:hypothetical protein